LTAGVTGVVTAAGAFATIDVVTMGVLAATGGLSGEWALIQKMATVATPATAAALAMD
jgi:hypothetical protein